MKTAIVAIHIASNFNMANQVTPAQQHLFRYQSFQIDKSQPLGHGSYGAVYKAKCDQLPCAAKILHRIILDPKDPGADKIRGRFSQECALLESIRHPNIVQYLAMTVDPESRLPVLLMELLDESLTKMLERSPTVTSLLHSSGHLPRRCTSNCLPPLKQHHPPRPLQQQCAHHRWEKS